MAKDKTLRNLFHDTLKDIYFAEKKILGALPKMAKAAQSKGLKAAFEKHEGETEGHVSRLEQVFRADRPEAARKLLDATLAEEKTTDQALTALAESEVNPHAEAA